MGRRECAALVATVCAVILIPTACSATTGGTSTGEPIRADSGGERYSSASDKVPAPPRTEKQDTHKTTAPKRTRPTFRFTRASLTNAHNNAAIKVIRYQLAGTKGRAWVATALYDVKTGKRLSSQRLGKRRNAKSYTYGLNIQKLTPGSYRVLLRAQPVRKKQKKLLAEMTVQFEIPALPADRPAKILDHVFPLAGKFKFGDGFGVSRGDHMHQGQDIAADSGVPVLAPTSGFIYWSAYQPDGAGYYLVLRAKEADYVMMHLKQNSILVEQGEQVYVGQRLASVGSTGHSTGPHLHFEKWPWGWHKTTESRAVNCRPDLERWLRQTKAQRRIARKTRQGTKEPTRPVANKPVPDVGGQQAPNVVATSSQQTPTATR